MEQQLSKTMSYLNAEEKQRLAAMLVQLTPEEQKQIACISNPEQMRIAIKMGARGVRRRISRARLLGRLSQNALFRWLYNRWQGIENGGNRSFQDPGGPVADRPPWVVFPLAEDPMEAGVRFGGNPDLYWSYEWLPFWDSLSPEQKTAYLDEHNAPESWRGWAIRYEA